MWLFTVNGYFSIVQDGYCKEDEVTIRARMREDLEQLLKDINLDLPILEIDIADYRYRVIIKKDKLKEFMNNYIDKLDYSNFKNSIKDKRRSYYYGDVWWTLYNMGNDLD